jgi:hypothetical protein
MRTFLLFSFLATLSQVQAEYRVYVLEIESPSPTAGEPPQKRTVQSTLDPEQYKGYYPVGSNETIRYTETWLCRGRTSHFQDFCPNPSQKAQIPDSGVINQNTP